MKKLFEEYPHLEDEKIVNKYPNVYKDWGFDEPVLTDVYVKKAGC